MRKFLSSIVLLVLSLFTVNVSAQTVGETILGTPNLEFLEAYASQGTYIKFNYPATANFSVYTGHSRAVKAQLYQGETLIEEATYGFAFSPTAFYGFSFTTKLDSSKDYRVEIPQGVWWVEDDKTGDNVEESPAKTLTIAASQGGGEQGGGEGGGGSEVTPWSFTSVTPAAGNVASLNKITLKAAVDLGSITGMTKGTIKCNETNVTTNIFFMPSFAGDLEASFTKITAEGTYTLTVAEGAATVNGNPNNEFTVTWTIGQVTPPAPTTTTLSLNATSATLNVGDTKQLTASTNVTALIAYESSNPQVATVDETGLVRAVGAGTCTITASIAASDDHTAASATCEVTVNAPAPTGPFASITIGSDVIELSENEAIELYEYPAGAVIKINLSDAAILGAWYEIKDLTTNDVYKSFAEMQKGEGYYSCEMPRTYGMVAGHNYAIHAWFKNKASQLSGQILYEYNFLVKGTNNDVPVLSTVSFYESVSPTEDFVLTGVTGTNTIDVRFKGEAPASATAWATVGQGSRVNLTTTISGQTVKVTVPNSAIAQGVLVLFVQAKDSEGHIIGGGDQSVNPDNGALSFSWLAEVGLEQPRMLEANTTVDELKTVTFKASDILSLDEGQLVTINGAVKRRYQTLQVMDKLGNVIVSEVTADQYEQVGNDITLTLKSGIVEAGEYTIVLPYGAFLIGEEMQAASNASGTYVVTVSGNLEPESDNILGDPVFTVTADQITISFPNAKIPAGITDGEVTLPGGVIVNTPDGTEDTEKYAYPDAVTIPTTDVISFTFNNPCGANAIVTIPAEGIQVVDYTTDYFNGTVIYTNSEALTNNTTSGINAIKAAAVNGAAFNIAGQKVNADAKGIIIVNGKKQVNK